MGAKRNRRKFCLATDFWDSADGALRQYRSYRDADKLRPGTKVVEVRVIYDPQEKIDLIKEEL